MDHDIARIPRAACMSIVLALGVGCGENSVNDFTVTAVEPGMISVGVATPAAIVGTNFRSAIHVGLDPGDELTVRDEWRVDIAGIGMLATPSDPTQLSLVLDAALPAGLHDVTITGPNSSSRTLPQALRIIDPATLSLHIETQPGGTGAPIPDQTINIGESVPVFAVVRTEGMFLMDDSVQWSVSGGIGDVTPPDGSAADLQATTVGMGRLMASHQTLGVVESGLINVVDMVVAVGLDIVSVSPPASVTRGQQWVKVGMEVNNDSVETVALTGAWLEMYVGNTPLSQNYTVIESSQNPQSLAPGATATIDLLVAVDANPTFGAVSIDAKIGGIYPIAGVTDDVHTVTWDVVDADPPVAVVSDPLHPNNRRCTGDAVLFDGSNSLNATGYEWALAGASPTLATGPLPTNVTYATPGTFTYDLTVTDAFGRSATSPGPTPVFVGDAADPSYLVGELLFTTPTPGQQVDVRDIGLQNTLDQDQNVPSVLLTSCTGSALGVTGATATVFIDRGTIDPILDIDLATPGIQRELHLGNHFDDLRWLETSPMLEGDVMVYAEIRHPTNGFVTASGWVPFELTRDDGAPIVDASLPGADCTNACYGQGERWLFRFNEPMDPAFVLSQVRVHTTTQTDCGGGLVDVTSSAQLSYDADARVLSVVPPSVPIGDAIRVLVPDTLVDASSRANRLAQDFVRCAVMQAPSVNTAPAAPTLTNGNVMPVSPDGDQSGDTTDINVTVDDNTALIRVVITRGPQNVRTLAFPVWPLASGSYSVRWNGRDNTERTVPDGNYLVEVIAENRSGLTSPPLIALVAVDSAPEFVGVPSRY